jgi:demethylmenaquinone methyltransferase / 2-methoxy-6-polyprenyl-1,4-benzoquinol methylase
VTDRNRRIFSRIARRYDFCNRVLSLGQEQNWRSEVADYLPSGRVLDLGSGTGAALPVLAGRVVVALDPVAPMLSMSPIHSKVVGVGESLPFPDQSFDSVFSAYVFRNLSSVDRTMEEIHRVLRPGGVAGIIDLARPIGTWKRRLHTIGTAVVLPMAGLLVGAPGEYWYLHRSLGKLAPPERLFGQSPLRLEKVWRMGPLGFVYGAILMKET